MVTRTSFSVTFIRTLPVLFAIATRTARPVKEFRGSVCVSKQVITGSVLS